MLNNIFIYWVYSVLSWSTEMPLSVTEVPLTKFWLRGNTGCKDIASHFGPEENAIIGKQKPQLIIC